MFGLEPLVRLAFPSQLWGCSCSSSQNKEDGDQLQQHVVFSSGLLKHYQNPPRRFHFHLTGPKWVTWPPLTPRRMGNFISLFSLSWEESQRKRKLRVSVGLAASSVWLHRGRKTVVINISGCGLCAKPCCKHFTCMISFSPYLQPMKLLVWLPHSNDLETEAQHGEATFQVEEPGWEPLQLVSRALALVHYSLLLPKRFWVPRRIAVLSQFKFFQQGEKRAAYFALGKLWSWKTFLVNHIPCV